DANTTFYLFFFSSRRRHTRFSRDWSSDVCSSDLKSDTISQGYWPIQPIYDHQCHRFQGLSQFVLRNSIWCWNIHLRLIFLPDCITSYLDLLVFFFRSLCAFTPAPYYSFF